MAGQGFLTGIIGDEEAKQMALDAQKGQQAATEGFEQEVAGEIKSAGTPEDIAFEKQIKEYSERRPFALQAESAKERASPEFQEALKREAESQKKFKEERERERVVGPAFDTEIDDYLLNRPAAPTFKDLVISPSVKGVANAIDFIPDVTISGFNVALNEIKIPKSSKIVDGQIVTEYYKPAIPTRNFNNLMEGIGFTLSDDQMPQNAYSTGLQWGAEGLLFSGALAKWGWKYLDETEHLMPVQKTKATEWFRSSIEGIGKKARERPKSFFGSEYAWNFTSGLGFGIATEKYPDSPMTQLSIAIASGTLPQYGPVAWIERNSPYFKQAITHALRGNAGWFKAAYRLQSIVNDPGMTLDLLKKNKELIKELGLEDVIDSIDASEDLDLMSVRAAILHKFPELGRTDKLKQEQANFSLWAALDEMGAGKTFQENIDLSRESLDAHNLLFSDVAIWRVEQAQERFLNFKKRFDAEGGIDDVGKQQIILEEEYANELRLAEKDLHDWVKGEWAENKQALMREVNAGPLTQPWKDELFQRGTKGFAWEKIDSYITTRLGTRTIDPVTGLPVFPGWTKGTFAKPGTTYQDIQDFRSTVLGFARDEAGPLGGKNADKIRYYSKLADDAGMILENGGEGLGDGAKFAWRKAVTATNIHKNLTQKGLIGKMLGVDSTGVDRVNDKLTISTGLKGPDATKEANLEIMHRVFEPILDVEGTGVLKAAQKGQKIAKQYLEDHIAFEFSGKFIKGNEINAVAAQNWINSNKRLLSRMPDLKKEMEQVAKTGKILQWRKARQSRLGDRLADPGVAWAAVILKGDPIDAFKGIADSANPAKEMAKLVAKFTRVSKKGVKGSPKQHATDPTGKGLEGLQRAYIDWIQQQVTSGTRTPAGTPLIMGYKLNDIVNGVGPYRSHRQMAETLLSNEQQRRIQVIAHVARTQEARRGVQTALDGIMGPQEQKLLSAFFRGTGARLAAIGQKMMGGPTTLVIPALGAERGQAIMNEFIKNPAGKLLQDAIMGNDEELFKMLTTPITNLKIQREVDRQLQTWALTTIIEFERIYGGETQGEYSQINRVPFEAIQ
jgi:hypothetical protein